MYELRVQGDRMPGAFFRMKGGVRRGGKRRAKGEKDVVLSHGHSGLAILARWVLVVRREMEGKRGR